MPHGAPGACTVPPVTLLGSVGTGDCWDHPQMNQFQFWTLSRSCLVWRTVDDVSVCAQTGKRSLTTSSECKQQNLALTTSGPADALRKQCWTGAQAQATKHCIVCSRRSITLAMTAAAAASAAHHCGLHAKQVQAPLLQSDVCSLLQITVSE